MKAMVLKAICDLGKQSEPLHFTNMVDPIPNEGEVLITISACGVCHTELDEIEGRTPPAKLPVILGHQVVGRVTAYGTGVRTPPIGTRVGVAWIFSSCGHCNYCLSGRENLCPEFRATGRDANGGYATKMCVPVEFVHPLPDTFSDEQAAPLLCAGAVGYRSLRLAELKNGQAIGLTGFGASGHLVLKMIKHRFANSQVYVFARSKEERQFAFQLGAHWAGDTADRSPRLLDAIIDTTPVWKPVLEAMNNLKPGGRLVINAIRKEEGDKDQLLGLSYENQLWMEKEIKSVANVTRRDVREFLDLAAEIPLLPEFQTYELKDANTALIELKQRKIRGAKVLIMPSENRVD